MIELIPAIDIINGECVRLLKGDYAQKTVYGKNPVELAKKFESAGFRRLHVVDLDGAKAKHIINESTLHNIAQATSLKIDFGGGIKTLDGAHKAFDNGAAMICLGSIAVTQPELFSELLTTFGSDKIILTADVKDGKIAINGWEDNSSDELFEFLQRYVNKGVKNVLCTDISKDGTLLGTSLELYDRIKKQFPHIYLIASGGVASNEDIINLDKIGVDAVVVGKAFYEGRIDITKLRQYV